MNIHVKYFASIRDSMGVDSEDISIDKSLTVYELWGKFSKWGERLGQGGKNWARAEIKS